MKRFLLRRCFLKLGLCAAAFSLHFHCCANEEDDWEIPAEESYEAWMPSVDTGRKSNFTPLSAKEVEHLFSIEAPQPKALPPSSNQSAQDDWEKLLAEIPPPPSEKHYDKSLAQAEGAAAQQAQQSEEQKKILINFNNVSMVEFIRFVSRVTNKNFVFNDTDLDFNVTIVSEEPTTLENIMTALMQELRIHGLVLIEQGNNLIIHNNRLINSISEVVDERGMVKEGHIQDAQLVTQVFRLNTLDAEKTMAIIQPLISDSAIVEVLKDTNHLIVTDISVNVVKIGQLLKTLDAPNSGLTIGQYVVVNGIIDSLIDLAQRVMAPIAVNRPLVFVPHTPSNSILVVSTPYIVDRTLAILSVLDANVGATRVFTQEMLGALGTAGGPGGFGPGGPGGGPGGPGGGYGPGGAGYPGGFPGQFPGAGGGGVGAASRWTAELPPGHIERTQFYIHKLHYRKGDEIVNALQKIGESLQETGSTNADLVSSINSIQWIESSNSLVFTGTGGSIRKVKELIEEIDVPLRQVFLEMLIIETTLSDSLEYSVNSGARFGGLDTAGSEAFLSGANTLAAALDTTAPPNIPSAASLARSEGFNLGIVGRSLTHCGVGFRSLGALVFALHDKMKMNVIMNPKIIAEDNTTAEIFVGLNTAFKTQSITNDQGSVITNNFEYRDVGTRLRVTPYLGNTDIITLEIEEEVSVIDNAATTNASLTNQQAGPTTRKNNTKCRFHIPNKYFLIISGMVQDTLTRERVQVPCLGGIPFIGAFFSDLSADDEKDNLMIFIRPQLIDTEEDVENLTRHNQNIFRQKERSKPMWKWEVDEAMNLLNLENTDGYNCAPRWNDETEYDNP